MKHINAYIIISFIIHSLLFITYLAIDGDYELIPYLMGGILTLNATGLVLIICNMTKPGAMIYLIVQH